MATERMYDSVNPFAIPTSARAVMGYTDGRYAWSAAAWARFPDAVKIGCSAIGVALSQVVDVEPGCVWPLSEAVPYVQRARQAGIKDVTVYLNMGHLAACKALFDAAGVAQPHYLVARYDGVPEVPVGTVGKQFAAPEAPFGFALGHYDVSEVSSAWLYGTGGSGGGAGEVVDELSWTEQIGLPNPETGKVEDAPAGQRLAWAGYYAGKAAASSADVQGALTKVWDLTGGEMGVADVLVAILTEVRAIKARVDALENGGVTVDEVVQRIGAKLVGGEHS